MSFTTEPTAQNGEGIRDKITFSKEAPTDKGVSRPVGNAIQNAFSIDSIPQNSENVNRIILKVKSFRRETVDNLENLIISSGKAVDFFYKV